jgi:hypothetical protein
MSQCDDADLADYEWREYGIKGYGLCARELHVRSCCDAKSSACVLRSYVCFRRVRTSGIQRGLGRSDRGRMRETRASP